MMEWVPAYRYAEEDGRLAVCAFLRCGEGYSYAIGCWSDEYNGFQFWPPGVMPEGQFVYWVPIDDPPKLELKPIDSYLEHIRFDIEAATKRLLEIVERLEE